MIVKGTEKEPLIKMRISVFKGWLFSNLFSRIFDCATLNDLLQKLKHFLSIRRRLNKWGRGKKLRKADVNFVSHDLVPICRRHEQHVVKFYVHYFIIPRLSACICSSLDGFIKRFSASLSLIYSCSAYDNDIDLRHWISFARQRRLHTLYLIVSLMGWEKLKILSTLPYFCSFKRLFVSLLKLNRSNEEVIYLNATFYEELSSK